MHGLCCSHTQIADDLAVTHITAKIYGAIYTEPCENGGFAGGPEFSTCGYLFPP